MNQYGKNSAPFEEVSSYEDILASQAQLDIFMVSNILILRSFILLAFLLIFK